MKFDCIDAMLKIIGRNKFKEMADLIKGDNKTLIEDKIIDKYCEIIFVIGVSKAFRYDCLSDKIKTKLRELDYIENIMKTYKEYINEVIKFCVEQHDKHSKEHLYTELDEFVEPCELRIE
ncbi:MAG: hypothetical protein J6A89_01715 [Clostridia bacterium]|nr:hypothetical protein [Clostridia bacterium]